MNRKFISKSNYVLRKVLNSEDKLDILKNFIESILEIDIKRIKLNPYLYRKSRTLPAEDNFGIADVRVVKEDDEEVNIGVQIIDGNYISTKMFLYMAQIHSNQVEYDDYRKIAKTITINILDFKYSNQKGCHNEIYLKNDDDYMKNYFEMHILELPKFIVKDNINNNKEAWISYFKGENLKEAIEKNAMVKKLDDLLSKYWEEEVMN